MNFRTLLLFVSLAAPVFAQEPAKPAPVVEKKEAKAEWIWPSPSVETQARYSKLSAAAKAMLQAEFSSNSEALKSLSMAEYNARFEKAFRAAVKEDEEKGLSTGGAPADLFRGRTLASSSPSSTTPPTRRSGPPPEVRARWEKMSDEAKAKMKKFFTDNRDRLTSMNEEDRRKFIESSFNTIADEDEAARKTK